MTNAYCSCQMDGDYYYYFMGKQNHFVLIKKIQQQMLGWTSRDEKLFWQTQKLVKKICSW